MNFMEGREREKGREKVTFSSIQLSVFMCGPVSCIVIYGHVSSCMVMYGYVWSCMVMHDHVWSSMVMYGHA